MKNILIVEDDVDLNTTVSKFLKLKSFGCSSAFDGQKAVDMAYEDNYDLIILDVKLPLLNGFEVATKIRENSNTPIIFLTSLNSEKDIEQGFLTGGDDYITKPFSLSELHLRINAILRRMYKNESKIDIAQNIVFDSQNLTLHKDNEPLHLTQKELSLLALFLQNRGKILTRQEIFENLYNYDEEENEASLRVFIARLRKIIGKEKIETIKNVGYRYAG